MPEAVVQRAGPLIAQFMPLGCIGNPDEIDPSVLLLASEGASYITGQLIANDGGRM